MVLYLNLVVDSISSLPLALVVYLISMILFDYLILDLVVESRTEKDMKTWSEKGLGIKLSDEKGDCISNLRFADDVLMMASSLRQLKRMIADFKKKHRSARARTSPRQKFSPIRNQTN